MKAASGCRLTLEGHRDLLCDGLWGVVSVNAQAGMNSPCLLGCATLVP